MNRNRKLKSICKKTITAAVCFTMVAANTLPVLAAETPEKEENVYASLAGDGSVSGIYVVNEYDLEEDTQITDHGMYDSVTNLSSEDAIAVNGDTYTVEGKKGKFYYQGNLESGELPWKIAIEYYLDGKQVMADDLAGKSGALEIRISVKENKDAEGDYFDNYLLQATVTLDSEKCKNINAKDATVANVGSDKQILYNLMAGQEKDISITADVTEFEMNSISFQGVPMSFAIDTDSIDMSELYDRTDELKDATKELDDGAGELKDGTARLADGTRSLLDAIDSLTVGAGSLTDGVNSAALGGKTLLSGSHSLEQGIDSYLSGVSSAATGGASLSEAAGSLRGGASALTAGTSQLEEGVAAYTAGVNEYVDGTAQYVQGVNRLYEGAKQLEGLENLGQVSEGITALGGGAKELQDGAQELADALGLMQEKLDMLESVVDQEQLDQLISDIQELAKIIQGILSQSRTMIAQYEETEDAIADAVQIVGEANQQLQEQADSASQQLRDAGASLSGQVDAVNSQIGDANAALSAAASSTNSQIDAAIGSVQAAMSSGAIDEATGNQLIGTMEASRVQAQTVGGVEVSIPETSVSLPGDVAGQLQGILAELQKNQEEIIQRITRISGTIQEMIQKLGSIDVSELEELGKLPESVDAMKAGADQLADGLTQLSEGLAELEKQTAAFPVAGQGMSDLLDGFEMLTAQNQTILKGGEALKTSSDSLNQGAREVNGGASQLSAGMAAMTGGVAELDSGMKELAAKGVDLRSGSGSLTQGVQSLSEGLAKLQAGTDTLSAGASALRNGVSELADGARELDDGAGEMKDGTEEFRSETADIDKEIGDEIDKLVDEFSGKDYVPMSFVSDKNTNVEAVQFAFQTDPITVEEEVVEEEEEVSESIWDKFRALFD